MIRTIFTSVFLLIFSGSLFAQSSEVNDEKMHQLSISCQDSTGEKGYMVWEKNGSSMISAKEGYSLLFEGVPVSPTVEDLEKIYHMVTDRLGEENMKNLLVHEVFVVQADKSLQFSFEFYLPEKGDFSSGVYGLFQED